MQEVITPLPCLVVSVALEYLALVVGECQISSASVNIKFPAKIQAGYRAALDVPPRSSVAPWRLLVKKKSCYW